MCVLFSPEIELAGAVKGLDSTPSKDSCWHERVVNVKLLSILIYLTFVFFFFFRFKPELLRCVVMWVRSEENKMPGC